VDEASLTHAEIEAILQNLAAAKIIDLNMSVSTVMKSVSEVLKKHPQGPQPNLHILCCNEYGLVTK
jgi:hypothetical protein